MSKPWRARSATERRALEAAFVARHGAELLVDGDAEDGTTEAGLEAPAPRCRLPFARLHAAFHGGGPLPAEVREALDADAELRDDFALLLRRTARHYLPRAAAAAGRGGLDRREADGFTLRVVPSRAGREQVYLLIDLPEEVFGGGAGAERDPVAVPASPPGPASGPGESPGPAAAAPVRLVVRTAAGELLKQDLVAAPEARTIRLVMAADDPLVRAVGEPASEIFVL